MKFIQSTNLVGRRLFTIWREPLFLVITVWGHFCILTGSVIFYQAEHGVNDKVQSFLDAIYWAMQTVTTVGYGDLAPITVTGKVVSIFMMAFGSLFLWTYASLLVSVILSARFEAVEKEISEDDKMMRELMAKVDRIANQLDGARPRPD